MSTVTVSPLRQRMIEDMASRSARGRRGAIFTAASGLLRFSSGPRIRPRRRISAGFDSTTPVEERWLFPGRRPGKPMTTRQLNRLFHEAADAAGIRKGATLHALRVSSRRRPILRVFLRGVNAFAKICCSRLR